VNLEEGALRTKREQKVGKNGLSPASRRPLRSPHGKTANDRRKLSKGEVSSEVFLSPWRKRWACTIRKKQVRSAQKGGFVTLETVTRGGYC